MEHWYDDMPELDQPVPDVLGEMRARTEAAMARLRDEHRPNLCPQCNGNCYEAYRDWETGEWCDGDPCPVCYGAGTIDHSNHADPAACEELYALLADEAARDDRGEVFVFDAAGADQWLDSYRADEQREYDPAVL